MNSLSSTRIAALFSGLFLAAALALLMFMLIVLSRADSFSAEAQEKIISAERRFAQARSFVRIHTETARARQQARTLSVSEEDIARVLTELEALARTAGVSLTVGGVDFDPKPGGALSLSLRFAGTFSHVYQFLALVETVPYAASIESASLQHTGEGTSWEGFALLDIHSTDEPTPSL